MRVILAQPRGFCAGVVRAIEVVDICLERYGPPVYVKHQIVHNPHVVADLERKGAITVDTLDQVPVGSLVVFSAHGSPPDDFKQAEERSLRVIDAVCPLVTRVHNEAVTEMAVMVDLVLVIGAVNSSNCNRLREVAASKGVPSYLINGPEEIEPSWLDGVSKVGITSGASTPEVLVESVISALEPGKVTMLSGVEEDVSFTLPRELR